MEVTKTYTRTYHVKSLDMCSGCEDNYYNSGNAFGDKCASYKKAKVVKCVVTTTDCPPPFSLTEHCLSCYHKRGYAYLKNFDKIKRGYYKGMYCYKGDAGFWESK